MNEPPRFILPDSANLRPRDEVRIESLAAQPAPDGRRVRVRLEVTPFREQPNFEITLFDQARRPIGGTTVIAAMNFHLEFTLHVRGGEPSGDGYVRANLYYDDPAAPVHHAEAAFHVSGSGGSPDSTP